MTTPYLKADISWDEAPGGQPVLKAYPDPLSPLGRFLRKNAEKPSDLPGDPWTIGFGSTGKNVQRGTVWTRAQCEAARDERIQTLIAQCSHFPWWDEIGDVRQDVFVNMAYQVGFSGLLKFTMTLAAAARGKWETVAADMKLSLWDKQTHLRAERLAEQARTGVRLPRSYDHEFDGLLKTSVSTSWRSYNTPPQPEPLPMSLASEAFHFVWDHTFAASARQAATADPNVVASGIAAVQSNPMPAQGTANSPAGVANPMIKQLEDDLNALVANFVKSAVDQLPVVGAVAQVTGLDQRAADAAKALLVLGEQHALTYLSALFSGHHVAINSVTQPANG